MNVFGRELSEVELRERTGDTAAVAGLRRLFLADGVSRGLEVVEVRTAAGLSFDILVGRGMDIGRCDFRGRPIAWRSGTGLRDPGLHDNADEGGFAWLRSFDGLLVTGGLDHAFLPEEVTSEFRYAPNSRRSYSLHGRVANIPARLIRAEEIWRGGACQLVVEGQVVQSTVFGERLELTRRIEVSFDGTAIKITDRVTNRGFEQTAHMLLYHINLGWPLVDEGAVVMVEGADPREIPPPNELDEVVTEHRVAATGGNGRASLLNSAGDQGVLLTWDAAAMPVFYEWRHLARGAYAVAFEPSTNRAAGRDRITRAGELIVLQHGETRTYRSRLEILPNRSAVTEALASTRGTPASAETLQSHQT